MDGLAAGDASVLDDAEVAMLLAILESLVCPQEHAPIVLAAGRPSRG